MTVRYNDGDSVIEVIIRDETGAKLCTYKCNVKDKAGQKRIAHELNAKWDIKFSHSISVKTKDMFDF